MGLKTAIQSKASQKKKNKHHIISFIYGIQKNSTDRLICKAEIENKFMVTKRQRESGMNWENGIDIYTL